MELELYCGNSTACLASSQYLDTFIGLKQMLVLERPNKLKTVIVPNFNLKTKQGSVHHNLVFFYIIIFYTT